MTKLLKILLIFVVVAVGTIFYYTNINFPEERQEVIEIDKNELKTVNEDEISKETFNPEPITPKTENAKKVPEPNKPVEIEEIIIEEEVVVTTPTPIRGPSNEIKTNLTVEGSIAETNLQRQKNGLSSLQTNSLLNLAAQNKVNDMFARQYFEHESPTGEGPSDLADAVGYSFLTVGENLALGNYENDAVLIQAWMDSPGHRANILNPKYTEIGIALDYGLFEGNYTWLAVQEFGRPASDCPSPNASLASEIKEGKEIAKLLEDQVSALYNEINNAQPKTGSQYFEKVETYNILIQEYNSFVENLRNLIIKYNNQVSSYNACI